MRWIIQLGGMKEEFLGDGLLMESKRGKAKRFALIIYNLRKKQVRIESQAANINDKLSDP